ncbi:hypothetical protein Tco_0076171, partial [Tanacetum coccineum]
VAVVGGGDGDGAWTSGSSRSGDGEAFGTWSENSSKKFSGGSGRGGQNPAGGGCRENWERREK